MMADEEIVDFKEEDILEMEEDELSQLGLETPDQFTSSELETLANIQAELDRLNKLEQIDASQIPTLSQSEIEIDGTVDSDDYYIHEETVTDTPQEEVVVIQEEVVEEEELEEELEEEYEEMEEEEEHEDETIEVETTPIEDLDIMMTTQEATTSQTKFIQIMSQNIKKQPLNVSGINLSKSGEQQYAKVIFTKQPMNQENTQKLVIKSSPNQKTLPFSQTGKLGLISTPQSSHHQGLILKSPTKMITPSSSSQSLNVTKLPVQSQKVIIRQANEQDQFRQMIRLPTSSSSPLAFARAQQPQQQQQHQQQQQQHHQQQQQQQQQHQQQQQQPQIRYIRLAPATTLQKNPQPVALISKYPQQQTILIPAEQSTPFASKKTVMIPTSLLPQKNVQQSTIQPIKKIQKVQTPIKFQEQNKSFSVSTTIKSAKSSSSSSTPAPMTQVTIKSENSSSTSQLEAKGLRPRKPCNCTKSQCLKLYCDCFANGEFCNNCNCVECCNNLEHEEDRQSAIKACLDRNPKAFRPKIGKGKALDERRHNRGCNCKRSNCLKNYCECYEAKIPCSNNCKCIGCNNVVDAIGNEKKIDLHSINARNKHSHERGGGVDAYRKGLDAQIKPFSFIESRIIKATCSNLLTEARKCIKKESSPVEAENLILENFRKCLKQVIESANTYMQPQPNATRRGIRNMPSRKRRSLFGR